MLEDLFLWILSCGMELGVIVLCLLPLRWILRKKVPRLFSYLLWCAVPVDFLYNIWVKIKPEELFLVRDYMQEGPPVLIDNTFLNISKSVWIVGTLVVLAVMVVSYVLFQQRLIGSIRLKENIYVTDRIFSPFSMGLLFPKIYLPCTLQEEFYLPVILHERVHIKRKDIWAKYVAIAFLALFWFHPVLWVAYYLFINDMEEACDEAVLRKSETSFRGEYARALVELSYQAGKVPGVAIGYGNGEIEGRVQNIMNYKKTGVRMWLAAGMMCIIVICGAILVSLQCPQMVQIEQKRCDAVKATFSVDKADIEVDELSKME